MLHQLTISVKWNNENTEYMSPCGSKNTIMQHRKVKAWPLVSLGFEYMPLILEAQKEDSKMFLIQMQSQSFTCKKQFFAYYLKIFLLRQRNRFCNLSKWVSKYFDKQFCLVSKCADTFRDVWRMQSNIGVTNSNVMCAL